jgi:anti-sigma regulatory factor (Ser/Thr protein kinase)
VDRRAEADFEATPEAVAAARAFVAATLAAWDLDDLAELAQLCTSEAASNAIRHARSAFHLRMESADREVLVRVEDHGPGEPVLQQADYQSDSGRGMWLISRLASRWGWERTPRGKVVWFALST